MRGTLRTLLLGLGLIGVSLCPALAERPAPTPDADAARLIAQLGSESFQERQQASRSLDAMGEKALGPLRKALKSSDPEVARRARVLVDRIERRVESARLLGGKRLRLVYKNTPLSEAVADFNRKAGISITVGLNEEELAKRKVTLDTGTVPLWEALDRFCRAARLTEGHAVASRANDPRGIKGSAKAVYTYRTVGSGMPEHDGKFRLVPAKGSALPTCNVGALRIRALPPNTAVTGDKGPGEKLLGLEITPQPGLTWQGLVAVRIDRAVDENGRKVTQPQMFVARPRPSDVVYARRGGRIVVYQNSDAVWISGQPDNPWLVPIRLRPPQEGSQRVAELRGTVTARVITPPETMLSIEKVLEAKGKLVKGAKGGSLEVLSVTKEEDGTVKMSVRLDRPPQALGGGVTRFRRVIRGGVRGRGVIVRMENPEGLELVDAKGVSYQPAEVDMDALMANPGQAGVCVIFRPRSGQAAPSKLVFRGRREATVEATFVLKNVALP